MVGKKLDEMLVVRFRDDKIICIFNSREIENKMGFDIQDFFIIVKVIYT